MAHDKARYLACGKRVYDRKMAFFIATTIRKEDAEAIAVAMEAHYCGWEPDRDPRSEEWR